MSECCTGRATQGVPAQGCQNRLKRTALRSVAAMAAHPCCVHSVQLRLIVANSSCLHAQLGFSWGSGAVRRKRTHMAECRAARCASARALPSADVSWES